MGARYLLLMLTFACPALGDGIPFCDNSDLKTIIQEASNALKTSAVPQDIAARLRSKTFGKQVSLTGVSITDLRDMDVLPLAAARQFSGVYTLEGRSYPDPSTLDERRVAEALHELMSGASWRTGPEKIDCSGAGMVVLTVKSDQMTLTYSLLASVYTFRRLRLGQLVSLEATISGVSLKEGRPEIFGVIRHVEEP